MTEISLITLSFVRRIIYKFLNVCPFDYTAVAVRWKVEVRLGYCFTPYQRLRLYNGAPFSRLLRRAGDTEDVFSA